MTMGQLEVWEKERLKLKAKMDERLKELVGHEKKLGKIYEALSKQFDWKKRKFTSYDYDVGHSRDAIDDIVRVLRSSASTVRR